MDPKQVIVQFKRPLFAASLVIIAAFWGYQRHNLSQAWASLVAWISAPANEPETEVVSATPEVVVPVSEAVTEPHPPPPRPRRPPTARRPTRPTMPVPRQPVMAPSLGETLDSIKPGAGVGNASRPEPKNLYFEKLRKDLRELQGGQAKPPPPDEEESHAEPTPEHAPLGGAPMIGQPPVRPRVQEPDLSSEVVPEEEALDEETFDGEVDPLEPEELLELEEFEE